MKLSSGPDVVIFGAGQVAEVMKYYIEHETLRKVVAFTVDESYLVSSQYPHHTGIPVFAFDGIEETYPPGSYDMFVAVSYRNINLDRELKCEEAKAKGYRLISHFSPKASLYDELFLRPNTFIMDHNVIQPYVQIGENVIIWSGNHIGHHTTIEDHCFIASHAVISGNVTVGEGTFIGVNATIRDGVRIGKRNVIGAGALILHDTPDGAVYRGTESLPLRHKDERGYPTEQLLLSSEIHI